MDDKLITAYYNSAYDMAWTETGGDKAASMLAGMRALIEHTASTCIAYVHDGLGDLDLCDPIETRIEEMFFQPAWANASAVLGPAKEDE